MTDIDCEALVNDCRDLYENHKTPFGLHMAMMLLDLFVDLSQKKPEETKQTSLEV